MHTHGSPTLWKKIPLQYLKKLIETSKVGVSLKDIEYAFSSVCMESVSLKIALEDIYRMPCPAIVYWDQCHFIVLYHIDIKKDIFYFAGPGSGKMKLSGNEFSKHWKGDSHKGVVVVAEPAEDFEAQVFAKDYNSRGLIKLIKNEYINHKKQFNLIVLFSLLCLVLKDLD